MYYYIYKISEDLKNNLKELDISFLNSFESNLNFNSCDRDIIRGVVGFESNSSIKEGINFEIDLEYRFLFVETNYRYNVNKSIEIIESFFNKYIGGELENFFPNTTKEHELICNSKDFNLKFLHYGELVDAEVLEDLENKYCKRRLDKSYNLIEANIQLDNNNNSFMYFRKALKIEEGSSKTVVFDRFKKVMA